MTDTCLPQNGCQRRDAREIRDHFGVLLNLNLLASYPMVYGILHFSALVNHLLLSLLMCNTLGIAKSYGLVNTHELCTMEG